MAAFLRRKKEDESMKQQKAVTRIAALFLEECYPGELPTDAAATGLDGEFRPWCDRRVHDPDVVKLLHEAEMDAFAEGLENVFTAPGRGFYSTMHVNPDGTVTRVWSDRSGGRPSSLPPTN
jgi:hypothetical protein